MDVVGGVKDRGRAVARVAVAGIGLWLRSEIWPGLGLIWSGIWWWLELP